jgi:SAM-dependent methyltransferase
VDPTNDFWERREQVERFGARDPDVRLSRLLPRYRDPATVRVLDLGCAAGRNTVLLAEKGFDIIALDASDAMVAETRRRLEGFFGPREIEDRIRVGRMEDLAWIPTGTVDLLVALGIFHQAQSWRDWERALDEAERVVRAGGLALVSVFTPETDLTGEGTRPVAGQPHVYEGFHGGGRLVLVDAATLDAEMSRRQFAPEGRTETVRKNLERGQRVSANGLYRKKGVLAG